MGRGCHFNLSRQSVELIHRESEKKTTKHTKKEAARRLNYARQAVATRRRCSRFPSRFAPEDCEDMNSNNTANHLRSHLGEADKTKEKKIRRGR